VTSPSGGPWPNLGEFLVVPDSGSHGGEIRLVCTLCPPRDSLVAMSEGCTSWPQAAGPTVSDLMAAATRHTWAVHRPPCRPM
jgi:hypothetical protein